MQRDRQVYIFPAVIGFFVFIASALDGRLYWHEGRLLYAVSRFTLVELITGEFNPHQLGSTIDTLSSGGYHLTKLLYLQLLDRLVSLPISADAQLILGSLLSLAAIIACAPFIRAIARNIGMAESTANWSAVSFLLMPCTAYLAGKLLSEVTALLPATLALWLWSRCLEPEAKRRTIERVGASILIVVTALARFDMVIVHIGFAVATFAASPREERSRLVRLNASVTLPAAALFIFAIAWTDGSFVSILRYLTNYLELTPKSQPMSIFGLLSFAGLVWAFFLFGLMTRTPQRKLLLIWLLVIAIPMVSIVSNYMIEPRYLVATSVPISLLAGIGLHRIFRHRQTRAGRSTVIGMLMVIPMLNFIPIALMPYEIERDPILRAADTFAAPESDNILLVPWAYTDYHFLRYARPDHNIFNVNTPGGDLRELSPEWMERLRNWYGDRYISDGGRIDELLLTKRLYYSGWGVYPPIHTVAKWSNRLGLNAVRQAIDGLSLLDHRTESWLWNAPRYDFEQRDQFGQYEIYQLYAACSSSVPTERCQSFLRPNSGGVTIDGNL